MKALKTDRSRQLHELCSRLEEISSAELSSSRTFEDEIQSSFNNINASDDSRKAAFQLCYEEQQQNVAVCGQWTSIMSFPVPLSFSISRC